MKSRKLRKPQYTYIFTDKCVFETELSKQHNDLNPYLNIDAPIVTPRMMEASKLEDNSVCIIIFMHSGPIVYISVAIGIRIKADNVYTILVWT